MTDLTRWLVNDIPKAPMQPWLTDQEIDDMCDGLITNAARMRHLRRLGLVVNSKPNGRPLVMRVHAEAVLSGLQQLQASIAKTEVVRPNKAALVAIFGKRRTVA